MSEKKPFTVRMTLAMQKDVRDYAHEYEMYKSDVVSEALKFYFNARIMYDDAFEDIEKSGTFEEYLDDLIQGR